MDADPSNTESGMSQSGPRNFFCHQCNSRTRVSIEVSRAYLKITFLVTILTIDAIVSHER